MVFADFDDVLKALLVAVAVDALLGDPARIWRRLPHPVVAIGALIAWLERFLRKPDAGRTRNFRGGVACIAAVTVCAIGVGAALHVALLALPMGWIVEGLLMSTLLSQHSLYQHVQAVAAGLVADLAKGRRAVAEIVGRDPESLDRHGVARAAIESTAENLSDGVIAPLVWAVIGGLPGMLAYKAVNTTDSMIGYRNEKYRDFGRAAARLDDVLNWLPARLTGALIAIAASVLPRCKARHAVRAMMRDGPLHRSPNAGWPEAAMAGALGLRIAGPRTYGSRQVDDAWMGHGSADATEGDIHRALRVMIAVCALAALLLAALLWERTFI